MSHGRSYSALPKSRRQSIVHQRELSAAWCFSYSITMYLRPRSSRRTWLRASRCRCVACVSSHDDTSIAPSCSPSTASWSQTQRTARSMRTPNQRPSAPQHAPHLPQHAPHLVSHGRRSLAAASFSSALCVSMPRLAESVLPQLEKSAETRPVTFIRSSIAVTRPRSRQ